MKRKIIRTVSMAALTAALLAGCASAGSQEAPGGQGAAETQAETAKTQDQEESPESETDSETGAAPEGSEEKPEAPAAALEDGTYLAEFNTDSSMFHINEACDGKGTLTVENGEMVIHVSLASKNIVKLFPGLAEDARKDGAELLEPTTDSVTYNDGITEEVYGFDIPVPALDEEFDLALIGTKGNWYDHRVSVSNPEKLE